MPLTNYTTKTTGKVRKLVDFECPNCGYRGEHWEDEKPLCNACSGPVTDAKTGCTVQGNYEMRPVFSPKNNAQRAYVRDERKG